MNSNDNKLLKLKIFINIIYTFSTHEAIKYASLDCANKILNHYNSKKKKDFYSMKSNYINHLIKDIKDLNQKLKKYFILNYKFNNKRK